MQLAARHDEIGEIADGADVGVPRQRLDLFGEEAHRATFGAGANSNAIGRGRAQ